MPKNKLMRIILIVGSGLIIVGVSLMSWMLTTQDDRAAIEVELYGGKTETVDFEALRLVPGEQCEYDVKLKNENDEKYDLSLEFAEIEENTLKNFAYVRIIANGEVVCDELLATVFEDKNIVLPVDFAEGTNTELKFVYYLPFEVGNEAKNTEALFKLILTARNE